MSGNRSNPIRPEEIKALLPIGESEARYRKSAIDELNLVYEGKLEKFIWILGPCSADSKDPVLSFVDHLADVRTQIKNIILVPRIYTFKPRTNGGGYRGIGIHPGPGKPADLRRGILAMRDLHIEVLKRRFLPADEMLYTTNRDYIDDTIGWEAIGARTSEAQTHRDLGSFCDNPVGIKNNTAGDIDVLMHSIGAAQTPSSFPHNYCQIDSDGNPYAHALLRGAFVKGRHKPNYFLDDMLDVLDRYEIYRKSDGSKLVNPAITVDTNHSNSNKDPLKQPRIAAYVLDMMEQNERVKQGVKGLLSECYLKTGNGHGVPGLSETDACLGWEKTKRMLYEADERLERILH